MTDPLRQQRPTQGQERGTSSAASSDRRRCGQQGLDAVLVDATAPPKVDDHPLGASADHAAERAEPSMAGGVAQLALDLDQHNVIRAVDYT